jgi:flagellar hook-associated protein 1
MSIAGAFNSAGTGLTASARLAETVSNNVANAMTPGYARRTTELSSLALGGFGVGVRVTGTFRAEDVHVTAERRLMQAAAASAATIGEARDRALAAVGEPGDPRALASRATRLETAILRAVAEPSAYTALNHTLDAAKDLVAGINAAASEADAMRKDADAEIARQVETLNRTLEQIRDLNDRIKAATARGLDTLSLEDERARAIDRVAEIVPVRTVRRESGEVALFAANGGALLDGRPWPLSFERSGDATNGLFQMRGGPDDPVPVPIGRGQGLMDGGSLSALFEVRDVIAVEMMGELDRYARDLIDRFALQPPDGGMPAEALGPGGEGLFLDPGDGSLGGLALRLTLNPAVDPSRGGEIRRLRDGLDGTERPEGFGVFLQAMADTMTMPRPPVAGLQSTGGANGSAGFAAEISSFLGGLAARADENRAYLAGQSAILGEREAALLGVDTDAQLQYLMLVEQAYAANARVLSVVDQLLKRLLEI